MVFHPKTVIFKLSQQWGRDVAVYLIFLGNKTCYEFFYLKKNKAEDLHTYMCTGYYSARNQNDEPKSATRALIRREVITECNNFRRKIIYETTSHIRRNIMEPISKLDYGNGFLIALYSDGGREFHTWIRAFYLTRKPSLDEILKFCAAELTTAKSLAISIGNANLRDRYIRSDEKDRQKNALETSRNFHQHIVQTALAGVLSSTRELKQYLDNLVTNLFTLYSFLFMGKRKCAIEADLVRLTVKLELEDSLPFEQSDFKLLVAEAVKKILGTCGPHVEVADFDEGSRKGSVIVSGEEVQLMWAALSLYGTHFKRRVAVHLYSVFGFISLAVD
uniref:Ribonuclease P n=1 Tax=Heterorhabditis bacteriophora TaxID=37862 RepID=A0A1I7WNY1_HETBA